MNIYYSSENTNRSDEANKKLTSADDIPFEKEIEVGNVSQKIVNETGGASIGWEKERDNLKDMT